MIARAPAALAADDILANPPSESLSNWIGLFAVPSKTVGSLPLKITSDSATSRLRSGISTAVALPLTIVADAVSGVSGAGSRSSTFTGVLAVATGRDGSEPKMIGTKM